MAAEREALQTELGRNEGAAPDDGDQDGEGCVMCAHNRICCTPRAADEVMLNLEAILAMQCRLVHERLR